MNLLELLKGVDNAQAIIDIINKNASELKAKVLIDDGGENIYVPKSRLDEEIAKKKTLKDQADNTAQELEKLKTDLKGQDAFVKQVEDLQKKNQELDTKLADQTLQSAIKLKAIELQAKDKTGADVLAFIDKAKLKLKDDGTVDGLDDALKTLVDSKPYLFGEVQQGGTGNPGNPARGGSGGAAPSIGKLLSEQFTNGSQTTESGRDTFFK